MGRVQQSVAQVKFNVAALFNAQLSFGNGQIKMGYGFRRSQKTVQVVHFREKQLGHFPSRHALFGSQGDDFVLAFLNLFDRAMEVFFVIGHVPTV